MSIGLVIHIPHASTIIPKEYLQGICLSEKELHDEIIWSTDSYCDELFYSDFGIPVIAPYSRLACDVERFRDDKKEEGAKNGNGAFYTHTQRGQKFRLYNAALRDKALREIYDLHHKKLTDAVDKVLEENDFCLIIDGHSFNDDPFIGDDLPDFCIGADEYHTPTELVKDVLTFLTDEGYHVGVNYPYSGSMVPMKYYKTDECVLSVMIEVNKRLYLNKGTFDKSDGFDRRRQLCLQVVDSIRCFKY